MARKVNETPRRKGRMLEKLAAVAPGWKLESAKARFSELVRRARKDGPQRVSLHGKGAAVVVASDQFDELQARSVGRNLRDLLVNSPLRDLDFGEKGVKGPVRGVEL